MTTFLYRLEHVQNNGREERKQNDQVWFMRKPGEMETKQQIR